MRELSGLAPHEFAVAVAVYVNVVIVVTFVLISGYQSYVVVATVVPAPKEG